MKRIFLLGYMGVGKTTLGKYLSEKLNLEFVDLDLYIQARFQKTVSQLFEEFGEEGFRRIENKILKEVSDFENVVISTGGGAPCFYDNMANMNRKGTTIYLKATPELLSGRLITCREKRPLLQNKTDEELYIFVKESLEKRESFYSQAHIIFEPNVLIGKDNIAVYADQIETILNKKDNE